MTLSALRAAARPAGTRAGRGALLAAAVLAVLLAAFAVFPLVFSNPLATTYGFDTLIFIAAASAWNIFSGYSGYLSLGHAVFFGTGMYTVAVGAQDWHLAGDAVFGLLPLGLVALRVRRHTFVVITIAFFFIFQLMAFNFSFTGGTSGIDAPILNWAPSTFNDPFYYLALLIAVATVALSWLIRRSRFGLHLRAIRDDEDRARSLGVHAMRVKLAALTVSALITGLAGGLWYYFIAAVHPQSAFDPLFDLSLALMGFFGGLGTVLGPALGALILEPAQQWLTVRFTNDYLSEILLGALFLIVILFLPRGVLPTLAGRITGWRARYQARSAATTATTPGGVAPGGVAPGGVAPGGVAADGVTPGTSAPDAVGHQGRRPAGRRRVMTAELRTEGIRKAFGGVQALDGCTLTVPEGSLTGLIGPNGSGKTTLFNIMTGYERPDAGEVYLAGQRITGASAQRVFGLGLGRTFQLTRIFPRLTLLENMLVAARPGRGRGGLLARAGAAADRRRALELLEFTGIGGYATALAGTLSYGQRKLLELATVLAADPAIVLLDEPAGGVNPTLIGHIAARIRDLNARGTTFLIVEHNMEFVMGLCHQVTVLDYGTVVAVGPPDIIATDPRVLDAYLGVALDDEPGEGDASGR